MKDKQVQILERALAREKAARKAAEHILEEKSRELYFKSQQLEELNKRLELLVKEKTTQLKGVFENIVDAYVVMNLLGDVLKMNEAAENLLGYTLDNAINLLQLVHPQEQEKVSVGFATLIEDGAVTDFQVKIVIADKTERLVHINASLIYDENNTPVAAQGIVRDITQIKELEVQKEHLLEDLERRNDELQEYAHVVSHDLKSPLRSINALVNWIKEDNAGKLDAITLDNLELIETTLEKMEQLISDVLSYSSISGAIQNFQEVKTQQVLDDIIDLVHIPEHVFITIAANMPVITADAVRIQQVFQNLLSNAIRYCNKEKGEIKIGYKERENAHEFSVSDNGIGIEKKYHKKIFEIFQSLNDSKESTGIGLSIVKKIVEMFQGRVWLESEIGVGTTFYFTVSKKIDGAA